jgi:soluble lytic murein transglycosylase-like protein
MDLSTIEARKALVSKWAAKYGLDVAMVCAVCEQESSWNPWAVRFEPAFEARYIKPALTAAPTTKELTEAMSFGLMQIMGQVAIEQGFTGRFLTELCDPEVGIDYGCRKLQKCFATHGADVTGLLAYNGGGNKDYGLQVLARVSKYQ